MDTHSDVSSSSRYAKHILQILQKKKQKTLSKVSELLYLFATFFFFNPQNILNVTWLFNILLALIRLSNTACGIDMFINA